MSKFVVVGSGVVGLYTTYNLLEQNVDPKDITVIAAHFPGDESINYTSPYAGGNFSCISGDDNLTLALDKYTYTNLASVQANLGGPSKSGLDRMVSREYWDASPSAAKMESLKTYLDNLQEIPSNELPRGTTYGIKYLTWNFNSPKFIAALYNYLGTKGVQFERRKLSHIDEAYRSQSTQFVFNCTGLGASTLGGINDSNVYPTRGQVVVIKAPHIHENVMRWSNGAISHAIKRPYSNDQLVLGGFVHKDDWTADTFGKQTQDILRRITQLFPEILSNNPHGTSISDLEIVRVVAGLRPSRHGGVRIEKVTLEPSGKSLIHNYGASGYGYQAGLGMGHRAVSLALGRDIKL